MLFSSVSQLHHAFKSRQLKVVDFLKQTLAHIHKTDAEFNAFLSLSETPGLMASAETLDIAYDRGENLPLLAGIPIAIKDNICIQSQKTTCASKMLSEFISPYDATVIQKLRSHHVLMVGKTNMDEFAMGSSTENSAFFPSKNPWNRECVPGGSSGGSAVAVASGQSVISLGSDTGGSIRQPAAFCGIVGLKPTYGLVSRYGLVAFASSLDQIGPFARTVEDAAILLEAIAGKDPHDATSASYSFIKPSFENLSIKGLKIGLPQELFSDAISDDVKQTVLTAVEVLKSEGALVETVSMSSFQAALSAYYIIAPAEASSNLARFDGVRYTYRSENPETLSDLFKKSRGQGFGSEVKRRIILGTYVLSSGYYDAYYLKAQKLRTLIKEDFKRIFNTFDVILSPTTPSTAFKFGAHLQNPLAMYMADIATIPANMAGLPSLSIPCGFSSEKLPIGMQLTGKAFDDALLLKIGHVFQSKTTHHQRYPEGVFHGV